MRLFDSHAHYYDDAFDPDRAEVLSSLPALLSVKNCSSLIISCGKRCLHNAMASSSISVRLRQRSRLRFLRRSSSVISRGRGASSYARSRVGMLGKFNVL